MPTSNQSNNTSASQVARLLAHFGAAGACWFSSTRPDGRPHLAPIWHVVYANCIYVVTRQTSVRAANIRANANVSLALADTSNALIVEGVARPAAEMRDALRPLFQAKYDWDIATDAEYDDVIQVRPRKVMAWGSHGEGRWIVEAP
ncbi:MAG TPA: hypothetical protein DCL15_14265 [Chloroflexi bacterium]|nr:hypothetical protein [Chloroflexota bacterium]HHW85516.1 hypothetical protein [Chloroflexota bacterium]